MHYCDEHALTCTTLAIHNDGEDGNRVWGGPPSDIEVLEDAPGRV